MDHQEQEEYYKELIKACEEIGRFDLAWEVIPFLSPVERKNYREEIGEKWIENAAKKGKLGEVLNGIVNGETDGATREILLLKIIEIGDVSIAKEAASYLPRKIGDKALVERIKKEIDKEFDDTEKRVLANDNTEIPVRNISHIFEDLITDLPNGPSKNFGSKRWEILKEN
jgi:hypothetical protein